MKLVRAVAILVGLADLAFAAWFLVGGRSMPGVDNAVYPRWVGVCSLASAALLFMAVSDPERYFPVIFINTGGRALAVLVGIPAALSGQILAVVISEGALAAVLVLVVIHAIKERRAAAAEGGAIAKPVTAPGKPGPQSGAKPAS
jgi:hypothetical protein